MGFIECFLSIFLAVILILSALNCGYSAGVALGPLLFVCFLLFVLFLPH
jgi:hypothetical protein